jgi:hypothetical protein
MRGKERCHNLSRPLRLRLLVERGVLPRRDVGCRTKLVGPILIKNSLLHVTRATRFGARLDAAPPNMLFSNIARRVFQLSIVDSPPHITSSTLILVASALHLCQSCISSSANYKTKSCYPLRVGCLTDEVQNVIKSGEDDIEKEEAPA